MTTIAHTSLSDNQTLTAALNYAALGLAVIPLYPPIAGGCSCHRSAKCQKPGKHPGTPNGLKDGSCDPEIILGWWRRWPESNLGIVTGKPNLADGLVVLDVDGELGIASLAALEREHRQLPETWYVFTGGGGLHYYFTLPYGVSVRNSAGKLAPGLDVRGDGGYVVAPPSLHASA